MRFAEAYEKGSCPSFNAAPRDLAKAGLVAPSWKGSRPKKGNLALAWGSIVDAAYEASPGHVVAQVTIKDLEKTWEWTFRTAQGCLLYLEACGRIRPLAVGFYEVILPRSKKAESDPDADCEKAVERPPSPTVKKQSTPHPRRLRKSSSATVKKQSTDCEKAVDNIRNTQTYQTRQRQGAREESPEVDATAAASSDPQLEASDTGAAIDDLVAPSEPDPFVRPDGLADLPKLLLSQRQIFRKGLPLPTEPSALGVYFAAASLGRVLVYRLAGKEVPSEGGLRATVERDYESSPSKAREHLLEALEALKKHDKAAAAARKTAEGEQAAAEERARRIPTMPPSDPELDDPKLKPWDWVVWRLPELAARVEALERESADHPDLAHELALAKRRHEERWGRAPKSPLTAQDLRSGLAGALAMICTTFEDREATHAH